MAEVRSKPGKARVLIVDDEPDMLDFMERVLRRSYDVTITDDSRRALELLRSETFELLITDHHMPKVSGMELVGQLGDLPHKVIAIVISGFAEAPDIQAAMEQGAIQNYLLKPVDSRKLLTAIEQAYSSRESP